jgi:hypothetical protein
MGGDDQVTIFPEEDVGYLSGTNRSYVSQFGGSVEMEDTPATFEQLPHIFEAGIEHSAASKDGAGSGYIYAYNMPTTAAGDIWTYTLEFGDDQQEEEMAYGFVTDFTLSGAPAEAVTLAANWVGRQCDTGTKTAALTLQTVEDIQFLKGKLYIDGTADTHGTTQATNTWLGFNLDVTTGWQPVYTGDGEKYFSFEKNVGPEVMLDITFEHDATAVAEKAAWRAATTRMVRMEFTGASLTTSGTAYATKTFLIDLSGAWESFEKIGEQDGNDVVTGTMRCRYNEVTAQYADFTVVNELTSLP